MKSQIIKIFLLCVCLFNLSISTVFGLPSEGVPGHSDLSKISAEIKYKLPDSGYNGLLNNINKIFGNLKNYQDFLSSSNVSEDFLPLTTMHFYDPATSKGYLGLFPTAKDRASDFYKTALKAYCDSKKYGQPLFIESAWANLSHTLHLLQDMTTPAHTNDLSHITGDSYEEYLKRNWESWDNEALLGYEYFLDYRKPIYGSVPDDGKIIKSFDANGPVYYTGLKEYLLDYIKQRPYNSTYKLNSISDYFDTLANISHNSFVDKSMLTENQPLSWAQKRQNAEELLPIAVMYGAGLINTFWGETNKQVSLLDKGFLVASLDIENLLLSIIVNLSCTGDCGICNAPPEPEEPANDHPDDRFDVSDEFYMEQNFNMTIDKVIEV